MSGDNFHVSVRSDGEHDLRKALALFEHHHRSVSGYAIEEKDDKQTKLVLFWTHPNDKKDVNYVKLPYEMSMDEIGVFVNGWLEKAAFYEEEPDHDGSNKIGFLVYNDPDWDHVDHMWEGICAIVPVWQMYGK